MYMYIKISLHVSKTVCYLNVFTTGFAENWLQKKVYLSKLDHKETTHMQV